MRGSENEHIEFMQLAKGKDTGLLQVAVFEAKVSGGTSIAMISRDAFRMVDGMDFFRCMSYFNTGAGFFISNGLVVASLLVSLYFQMTMAFSRLDGQVLTSNQVYLVGNLTFIEWIAQLGLLSVIPLFLLYWLEGGLRSASVTMIRSFLRLSLVFFLFGIQTKAYFFDAGLTFGTQAYLATGRNFVLRHQTFDEIFRCTAHSHIYVGMEVLTLAIMTTIYGTFRDFNAYGFNMVTVWLYAFSILLGQAWFNPLQFELHYAKSDFVTWAKWLLRTSGPQEVSWRTWYEGSTQKQYEQVGIVVRIVRLLRICRLLIPATLLVVRFATYTSKFATDPKAPAPPVTDFVVPALVHAGVGLLLIFIFQLGYLVSRLFSADSPDISSTADNSTATDTASSTSIDTTPIWRSVLYGEGALQRFIIAGATVGCGILLLIYNVAAGLPVASAGVIDSMFAFFFFTFFWSRVLNIANVRFMRHGTRAAHKLFDVLIGIVLLTVQAVLATIIPFGHVIHTTALFGSSYGSVVSLLGMSTSMLSTHQDQATVAKGGAGPGGYAGGVAIPEAEPKAHCHSTVASGTGTEGGAPGDRTLKAEINIGVRNYRLRPLPPLLTNTDMAAKPQEPAQQADQLAASQLAARPQPGVEGDSAASEGVGGFSTIALPPLPGEPPPATQPPNGPTAVPSSAPQKATAGAGGKAKKSIKELLQEHHAVAAAEQKAVAAAKPKKNEKEKEKPKKHASDDEEDRDKAGKGGPVGNSVAARAAMFQRKAGDSAVAKAKPKK